jgi:hypothetical protein
LDNEKLIVMPTGCWSGKETPPGVAEIINSFHKSRAARPEEHELIPLAATELTALIEAITGSPPAAGFEALRNMIDRTKSPEYLAFGRELGIKRSLRAKLLCESGSRSGSTKKRRHTI